jgi:hypothetical protein
MPLDGTGKQYVELLYQQQLEALQKIQEQELQKVIAQFHGMSTLPSGAYLSARARVIAKFAGSLVEARAQALAKAYEESGKPLNHDTVQEITTEVNLFRDVQKNHVKSAASNLVTQNFGGPGPEGMAHTLAAQMEIEIDRCASGAIRDLAIRHHKILLEDARAAAAAAKSYAAATGKRWDVFISHASEDKDSFVRPLAAALTRTGLQVWFDETALTVGDSLRRKIDEGLAQSRFGIVVLSPYFFAKEWPQSELDGLVTKEVSGVKVILPVWHNIDYAGVLARSPLMAGRLAAKSSDDMDKVVSDLRAGMGLPR